MKADSAYSWVRDEPWVPRDAALTDFLVDDAAISMPVSISTRSQRIQATSLNQARRRWAVQVKVDPLDIVAKWTLRALEQQLAVKGQYLRAFDYIIELVAIEGSAKQASAAPVLPQWLGYLYGEPGARATRDQLRILLTEMRTMLIDQNFEMIDSVLRGADLGRLPAEVVMGLYRTAAPAKGHLENWRPGVTRALAELRRRGLPAESIMVGLLDKADEGSRPVDPGHP